MPLDFSRAKVVHNNLSGAGPDKGKKILLINNVGKLPDGVNLALSGDPASQLLNCSHVTHCPMFIPSNSAVPIIKMSPQTAPSQEEQVPKQPPPCRSTPDCTSLAVPAGPARCPSVTAPLTLASNSRLRLHPRVTPTPIPISARRLPISARRHFSLARTLFL